MIPHAKEWTKILHKRILNHDDPSLNIYKEIISTLNKDVQDYIISLLIEIKEKNIQVNLKKV